jgi:hypothetical protein
MRVRGGLAACAVMAAVSCSPGAKDTPQAEVAAPAKPNGDWIIERETGGPKAVYVLNGVGLGYMTRMDLECSSQTKSALILVNGDLGVEDGGPVRKGELSVQFDDAPAEKLAVAIVASANAVVESDALEPFTRRLAETKWLRVTDAGGQTIGLFDVQGLKSELPALERECGWAPVSSGPVTH